MLFVVLGACAVALTFAAISLMAAKRRLVDHEIEAMVARKLSTCRDALAQEVLDLREANGVMRNLLMDIAENEATAKIVNDLPAEVTTRIASTRAARRRELLAETEAVLRASYRHDASL